MNVESAEWVCKTTVTAILTCGAQTSARKDADKTLRNRMLIIGGYTMRMQGTKHN